MKQLISVSSENVTVFARFVAFMTALIQLMVNLNALSAGAGEAVIEFLNDPQTVATVNAVGTLIIVALPSVLGWRNRKKELPSGVTVDDVTVKPNAVDAPTKEAKLMQVSKTIPLLVACIGLAFLSACSCPQNQVGYSSMSMAQQKASGQCVVIPQQSPGF